MQHPNPKTPPFSSLKKLTCSPFVANSSLPLPSSPLGDCIGTESCIDLKGNDTVPDDLSRERRRVGKDEKFGKLATKKEFPPPIPSLARTENLSSHMPWVLRRYYTNDGRLILKEERVKHHEYFLAQRFNGRLTLQLIPLDDEIDHNYPQLEDEEEGEDSIDYSSEEEEEDENEKVTSNSDSNADSNSNLNDEEEESEITDYNGVDYEDQRKNESNNGGIGGNLSPPFKCLNYDTMIQSPTSIFQMPVPALRPVHT